MSHALFITAYDRRGYLQQTLDSWKQVRGFYDWPVFAMIEPSLVSDHLVKLFEELQHPNLQIIVHPKRLGVLHHPWVVFEQLFEDYDFVVRAEDDLLVSTDILEYFEFCEETFRLDETVATVIGFTHEDGPTNGVTAVMEFKPWVWGTWKDRWAEYIGPTWDHDYSTFNGYPGNQSGWDWNLNSRVFPALRVFSIFPTSSRVQNIGMLGTHATPDNFEKSKSFVQYREPCAYEECR